MLSTKYLCDQVVTILKPQQAQDSAERLKLMSSRPQLSGLLGLQWGQESAFLTSIHVKLMLLIQEPHF